MKKKMELARLYAPKGNAFTDISRPAFVAGFDEAKEMCARFLESHGVDERIVLLVRYIAEGEVE